MKYIILFLSLVCLLVMGASAQAGPAAFVQSITPEAWASGPDGRQDLGVGSQLQTRDSLHTNAGGRLSLRFSDGTELNMRESTSLDIADYVFEENVNFALNISSGAATLVTGAIVQQNPEAFKITTPLGTVGVRGTTVFVSVTNDKVVIVVLDMEPGHSVVVTGPDGQQVVISESGQQVELIRGEATPATSSPVSDENLAAIENPEDGTFSELPHRDVAEQQLALLEQELNIPGITIGNNHLPPQPQPQPQPVPPRTTYPAFALGIELPADAIQGFTSSAMSYDGGVVAVGYETTGGDGKLALWSPTSGAYTEIAVLPGHGQALTVTGFSGNGQVVTYQGGTRQTADTYVYRAGSTYSNLPLPPTVGFTVMDIESISRDGNVIVGQYDDSIVGGDAVGRWDWNGAGYSSSEVLVGGSPVEGYAYAVSADGSVIAGSNSSLGAAYWTRQGATNNYTETILIANDGVIYAMTPDARYVAGITNMPYQLFRGDLSDNSYQVMTTPPEWMTVLNVGGISDDGSVIAGTLEHNNVPMPHNYAPYIWTQANGIQELNALLTSQGVNMGSTFLAYMNSLSGDGSIVLCSDMGGQPYLVRVDGDYLGLTSPSNVYASIAGVAAGTSINDATQQIMSQFGNVSSFSLGNVPAAGEYIDGSVLRVWGTGAFMSNDKMNGDDNGFIGGAGATYFMDNGISLGASAFYGYRGTESAYGSQQSLDSMSFGLFAGYAPEVTGIRLSLGGMWQTYSLDTRRNYPNGADMATSSGKGHGWGMGLTGHLGWVFALHDKVTIQPFAEYTFQRTATPDYEESGGPFPASYERTHFSQNLTRVGADLQWDVRPDLSLQCWLAWNHRFEDEGPAASGQIIGWQSFYLNGASLKQNWGDTGIGLRFRIYDNTTLGARLGFGIDNDDSGLPDISGSLTVSVDI